MGTFQRDDQCRNGHAKRQDRHPNGGPCGHRTRFSGVSRLSRECNLLTPSAPLFLKRGVISNLQPSSCCPSVLRIRTIQPAFEPGSNLRLSYPLETLMVVIRHA